MTTVLLVAVVLLTLLVVADLALTLAIVRRLRAQPAGHAVRLTATATDALPVGSAVPAFTVGTLDGGTLSADALGSGRTLLAFTSESCTTCHAELPELQARLAQVAGEGGAAVVSVLADPADPPTLPGAVRDLAALVVETEDDRTLARAFQVSAYPTYVVVDQGRVAEVALSVADLAVPAHR
jgi:thiol-disulfide isomerase/thioredoxin